MKKAFSFFAGALMGGLVGATLAILFAPASGEELRGQLQERIVTVKDEIIKAAKQKRLELEQQLADLRSPD